MKRASRSVSVKISRAESLILRRIAFRARRTGGRKLASAAIVRALIRLLRSLDVDLAGARSVEELKRRLLAAKVRR